MLQGKGEAEAANGLFPKEPEDVPSHGPDRGGQGGEGAGLGWDGQIGCIRASAGRGREAPARDWICSVRSAGGQQTPFLAEEVPRGD